MEKNIVMDDRLQGQGKIRLGLNKSEGEIIGWGEMCIRANLGKGLK